MGTVNAVIQLVCSRDEVVETLVCYLSCGIRVLLLGDDAERKPVEQSKQLVCTFFGTFWVTARSSQQQPQLVTHAGPQVLIGVTDVLIDGRASCESQLYAGDPVRFICGNKEFDKSMESFCGARHARKFIGSLSDHRRDGLHGSVEHRGLCREMVLDSSDGCCSHSVHFGVREACSRSTAS